MAAGDDALGGSGVAMLAVAAVALAVFAVQLPALLRALYSSSDVTSLPALATLLDHVPADRSVTLGNAPEFEWLPILRATSSWPGHWQLWLVLPFLVAVAGFAVVARTTWTTWGRWPAIAAVAILTATAGEGFRITLFSLNAHAMSLLTMVVLGATLVAFARRPPRRLRTWVLAGAGLVALAGPATPDPQLLLTGIAPFAITAVVLWRLTGDPGHRSLAAFAVLVSGAAVGIGAVISAAMDADHVATWAGFELQFATLDRLPLNVSLVFGGLFELAGTAPAVFGQAVDRDSTLNALIGVPVVAGFAFAISRAGALLRRHLGDHAPTPPERPDRLAFVAFWALVIGLSLLACLFSTSPKPMATGRYLLPAFYGVAMLAPALAVAPRARAYVACGVLVFTVGVLGRHVLLGPGAFSHGPSSPTARAVQDYVERQHASVGYASTGDAGPLVWRSRGGLKVFPITNQACSAEACPGPLMSVSSWYLPRDGVRSYVVEGWTPGEAKPLALPPTAGAPIAQEQIGSVKVSVYDHDVARDLGSPLPTVPVGS
ncbi:MAG: hypothetical protein JWR63_317 [Conexibacter sp.]|nr:hypothetical protein [Conexibacter sp.]